MGVSAEAPTGAEMQCPPCVVGAVGEGAGDSWLPAQVEGGGRVGGGAGVGDRVGGGVRGTGGDPRAGG